MSICLNQTQIKSVIAVCKCKDFNWDKYALAEEEVYFPISHKNCKNCKQNNNYVLLRVRIYLITAKRNINCHDFENEAVLYDFVDQVYIN